MCIHNSVHIVCVLQSLKPGIVCKCFVIKSRSLITFQYVSLFVHYLGGGCACVYTDYNYIPLLVLMSGHWTMWSSDTTLHSVRMWQINIHSLANRCAKCLRASFNYGLLARISISLKLLPSLLPRLRMGVWPCLSAVEVRKKFGRITGLCMYIFVDRTNTYWCLIERPW